MTSELTKLSTEISSNPLLSNSISGIIGLIGGVVGGAIVTWATAARVRRSLEAQFELQRAEWQRRDREKNQERQDRETREQGERAREGAAAVQALAVEALWNSVCLATAAKQVENSTDPTPKISLSRDRFDKHLLPAMKVVGGVYMQQTANIYLSGFAFQQLREAQNRLPMSKVELKRTYDLSTSFMIIFRTLEQRVFSREKMAELDRLTTLPSQSRASNPTVLSSAQKKTGCCKCSSRLTRYDPFDLALSFPASGLIRRGSPSDLRVFLQHPLDSYT